MTTETINIVVSSSGAVTFKREVEGIGGASTKAATGVKALQLAAIGLKTTIATLAAGLGANYIKDRSDDFTVFKNSLIAARVPADQMAETQDRLFASANRGGAAITAMGELYGKASLAAEDLGISQSQLLDFMDRTSAALRVNGKSAAETSGPLLQFSQALGGGTVRAEEFNSILEGTPTIARAAADGWGEAGISVADLRNKVIAGEVSSKEFFDAFMKGSENLNVLAASMGLTFGQAFTVLNNGLTRIIGAIGETTGVFSAMTFTIALVGNTLSALAGYFDEIITVALTLSPILLATFGPALVTGIAGLASVLMGALVPAITAVTTGFGLLRARMMGHPILAIVSLIAMGVVALFKFRSELEGFSDRWKTFFASVEKTGAAVMYILMEAFDNLWPIVEKVGAAVFDVATYIGTNLVQAAQTMWGYVSPIIDAMFAGWERINNILIVLGGGTVMDDAAMSIDKAATDAASKLSYAHQFGGAKAAAETEAGHERGGKKAGKDVEDGHKRGAEDVKVSIKATYEEMNGKLVTSIGKVLDESGEFFVNKATGEITKAGKQAADNMNAGIDDGGQKASRSMEDAVANAGMAAGQSMFQQLAGLGDMWSNSLQKTIGELIDRQMRMQNDVMRAQAELFRAQAKEARAEARLSDREAELAGRDRGGGGRSGGSGGSGSFSGQISTGSANWWRNGGTGREESDDWRRVHGTNFQIQGGFDEGGSFMVRGQAGRDRVPVAFMAGDGERVNVQTRKQQRDMAAANNNGVTVDATNTTINVLDAESVFALMESRRGRQIQINNIKFDKQQVNRALGAR